LAPERGLKNLRLRFIVLLDQKTGREKAVLRRSIEALDRKIRRQAEKTPDRGYTDIRTHPRETRDGAGR
jgi:hypothetical protein